MRRSSSNVIFIKLDKSEYDFVFEDVSKSGKTVKGWFQLLIKELQARRALDEDN